MFIGIDIGTTATKAILVDEAQAVLASATYTYKYNSRIAGYAEQHPQIWVDAAHHCLVDLRKKNAKAYAATKAISFSGQMHSLVALDGEHKPIKPAMLWNDARGQSQANELAQLVPDIESISGAAAMPSFTASKLLWMRQNESDLFGKIKHILLPKDFVRLWLTGNLATDHSDAAGTQLYNQQHRKWSDTITSVVGLNSSALPQIYESNDSVGKLRRDVAAELELPPDCEIIVGGADTADGALGLGCVAAGDSFISLGTGSIFATITDGYHPTNQSFLHNFAHCLPNQFYRMGAMLNGASALAWAARLVGAEDIGELLKSVEANFKAPSRVMFIPYLNGERTPHNNAELRGALLGLDSDSNKLDVAQAVIEGVSFCLRDAMLALGLEATDNGTVGLIGGGARSLFWTKILASILAKPIARYEGADLWPALGAVRLAMLANKNAKLATIATKPKVESIVVPNENLLAAYAERYSIYKKAQQVSFDFANFTGRAT